MKNTHIVSHGDPAEMVSWLHELAGRANKLGLTTVRAAALQDEHHWLRVIGEARSVRLALDHLGCHGRRHHENDGD
jgi:hypothetical protein